MASVIGIDVGGTCIKAARFATSGQMLARIDAPTPTGPEVADAVRSVARQLFADDTAAAAVVLPGILDRAAGVVRWSANLAWRDVPLQGDLAADLGVPVVLEHDVTAAALAEQEATGTDLLYVALGTGVGAACIADGIVLRGATGLAGELGHVPVRSPDGEPCVCGQVGCLETYASAASIARRYAGSGGRPGATSADVAAARDTDPVAARVWREAVEALGCALAIATLVLDPHRIVLGGGLAGAGAALTEPVAAELAARLRWRPAPALAISSWGADAGIRGAALLARQVASVCVGPT